MAAALLTLAGRSVLGWEPLSVGLVLTGGRAAGARAVAGGGQLWPGMAGRWCVRWPGLRRPGSWEPWEPVPGTFALDS